MNITEKTYSVSIKATKNFNSVSVTEGITVKVDDTFADLEWEVSKQELKDRLIEETKKLINKWDDDLQLDKDIELLT
jgi:hypothetical protein